MFARDWVTKIIPKSPKMVWFYTIFQNLLRFNPQNSSNNHYRTHFEMLGLLSPIFKISSTIIILLYIAFQAKCNWHWSLTFTCPLHWKWYLKLKITHQKSDDFPVIALIMIKFVSKWDNSSILCLPIHLHLTVNTINLFIANSKTDNKV